jgi:hypothetical protein
MMPTVCTICGQAPTLIQRFNVWEIYCGTTCYCLTSNTRTYKSEHEAVEAWNNQNRRIDK